IEVRCASDSRNYHEPPGRTDPCPCGSGRTYAQCRAPRAATTTLDDPFAVTSPNIPNSLQSALEHHKAFQSAIEHHRAGHLAEAKAICLQLLQAKPDHHKALHLLGLIAHQEGENDIAVKLISRAIQADPSNPVHHYNLGSLYNALNKLDEAIACYRKALALRPDDAETLNNLGNTLKDQGMLDEAIDCYRRALAIQPDYAEAYTNLGIALTDRGNLDEAIACYRQALAVSPDYVIALNRLGLALNNRGAPDEAMACYRQALAIQPDSVEAHSNKLLIAHYAAQYSPAELLAEHLKFAEQFEAPLKPSWRPHTNTRDPEKRMKVGYVSPDLRHHAVAYFIEPVLAHHDKSRVEVFCYYNHTRQDSFTDRLRAAADHWASCQDMPDERLAERIRADGIDILVDLAGHTGENRLLVFARKPAPVQVTYLGYINTTGLSAMDYRLTHIDADPPGNEAYYSETLYRLPGDLWWCYRPPPGMPGVAPPPAIANGFVTFGSTNNIAKLSPETIATWADVLRALPDARLIMAGIPQGSAQQSLCERFSAHGIDPQRLTVHGRLSPGRYWELHHQIDIVLDPFPYNGGTTTCDALSLGVPVVALAGQEFVSRMGYALLKNIGLPELAAASRQDYVKIAVSLAGDPERLKTLRTGMRERLAASPLRDEAGFTRNLETAYREMWRKWCARTA